MDEDIVVESDVSVTVDSYTQDIARYFKTMLETNLDGNAVPARRMSRQRLNGLRAHLYIEDYPQLHKNMYRNVVSGFAQDAIVVSQNKYVKPEDELTSDLLTHIIEIITKDSLKDLSGALVRVADTHIATRAEKAGESLPVALSSAEDAILSSLTIPLFRDAFRSLSGKTKLDDRPSIELQIDATEKLYSAFKPAIERLYAAYFAGQLNPDELYYELVKVLDADLVKLILGEFYDETTALDAYNQVYQLHRNNKVLTDTQQYLNFCELSIGEYSFPLFYTPLNTSHAYPSVTVSFGNQIFVNTKALDYVIKMYGQMVGLSEVVTGEIDSSFAVTNKNRTEVLAWMQEIIDVVSETFDFDTQLKLDNNSFQTATNVGVSLSNTLQISIFHAPKDAVLADYSSILEEPETYGVSFQEMVSHFIEREPVRYVEEVAEEWKNKPLTDKLLPTNFLPMNDEQKQALLALSKPDCNITVVRGATGTGKTHFAGGIMAQALVDGKTALVLADTKATRDAIAQKVTNAIAEVREGMAYHDPVLRLDFEGDHRLDEIETQFIDKLQAYHQKYTSQQSELKTAKNRKIKDTTDTITELLQNGESVNLHEVEQMVNHELKYGGRNWLQGEPIEELGPDLQQLHQAVHYIRNSEANYLLPYIESSQQKVIAEFISILREYERANKNVDKRLPDFIVRYRKLLGDQKNKLQSSLSYVHSNYRQFVKILSNDPITAPFEITENSKFEKIASDQITMNRLVDLSKTARKYMPNDKARGRAMIKELLGYKVPPEEAVAAINIYVEQVESLKSKIFGFSGRTLVVENLTRQLRKAIPEFTISEPEKKLEELEQMVALVEYIIEQLAQMGLDLKNWKQVLHVLSADVTHIKEIQNIMDSLSAPAKFEFMTSYRVFEADNLMANISLLEHATELNRVYKDNQNLSRLFGIKTIGQVLAQPQAYTSRFNKLATDLDDVKQLEESKKVIKKFIKAYPDVIKRLGLTYSNGTLTIDDEAFANSSHEELKEYLSFKRKEQDVTVYFREMIADNYARSMTELRQIAATQISYKLDAQLVQYIEKSATAFQSIKRALASKQPLSEQQFRQIRSVFPCIIANTRDYAAFLPLQPDLFDVVVIDDATHVNIAEVLPALMRAKKTIVLGDDTRTVNTTPWYVNVPLNNLFRRRIEAAYQGTLPKGPADTKNKYLKRLRENFDISNSVFDFCTRISNIEFTFTNYFQTVPELADYTNKTFYGESLKCLKARALPLQDTIKIDHLEVASDESLGLNVNATEAKYIVKALNEMKDNGFEGTIGIITPYYEQATLIQRELDESVISDWFERHDVTVMTFDTARGEVRDYIFYSMVATAEYDHLTYVMPATKDSQSSVTAQRLITGLSRATTSVHFVISKPVSKFEGAAGDVLHHYETIIAAGSGKSSTASTDLLLAADSLLPHYFHSTKFYKKHSDKVRLLNKFSLGDLIRPLVPKYRHPAYKVDFMVTLGDERIIITFDEFKEKFLSHESKDVANYLSPQELYAQKTLEEYGYHILRLNKYNLGPRPVDTLDKLLAESVKKVSWPRDNGLLFK